MEPVVLLADGRSYERAAITTWLSAHDVSPITGRRLSSKDTVPNRALKSLIEAVAQAQQLRVH